MMFRAERHPLVISFQTFCSRQQHLKKGAQSVIAYFYVDLKIEFNLIERTHLFI